MASWNDILSSVTAYFPKPGGVKPAWDLYNVTPNAWDKLISWFNSGWPANMNGGGNALVNVSYVQTAASPAVFATNTAGITLANATFIAITWDNNSTGVAYNVGATPMHSTSTNPSRFTAHVAGAYMVGGSVGFVTNSTGERIVKIVKNGSVSVTFQNSMAISGDNTFVGVTPMRLVLAINDYVEIQAYQTSGGNLNTYGVNTVGWAALVP